MWGGVRACSVLVLFSFFFFVLRERREGKGGREEKGKGREGKGEEGEVRRRWRTYCTGICVGCDVVGWCSEF